MLRDGEAERCRGEQKRWRNETGEGGEVRFEDECRVAVREEAAR